MICETLWVIVADSRSGPALNCAVSGTLGDVAGFLSAGEAERARQRLSNPHLWTVRQLTCYWSEQ